MDGPEVARMSRIILLGGLGMFGRDELLEYWQGNGIELVRVE